MRGKYLILIIILISIALILGAIFYKPETGSIYDWVFVIFVFAVGTLYRIWRLLK